MSDIYCREGFNNICDPEHCRIAAHCEKRQRSVEPLNPLGERDKAALQPTMTDDDSPNVACYRLGYDVGVNMGLDAAIKQVKHFAYVSGLSDEGMLIAAINACRVTK